MSQAYDIEHEKLVMKLLEYAPPGVRREHIERAIPAAGEWAGYRRAWKSPRGSGVGLWSEREFAEIMRAVIWQRVFVEVEVDRRVGEK